MLILNKKGFAEIKCNKKTKVIHEGFATKLTAKFHHYLFDVKEITPVWIIECDNIENYDIEELEDGTTLSISTYYDNTGDIVNIILADKENNYQSDNIQLEVIGH